MYFSVKLQSPGAVLLTKVQERIFLQLVNVNDSTRIGGSSETPIVTLVLQVGHLIALLSQTRITNL